MIYLPERIQLPCLPEGQGYYETDGLRVHFACTLPGVGGVCKVWVVREGRRLLLGTPEPVGDGLALRRTVSCAMLRQQGVFPPQRLEISGGQAGERPPGGGGEAPPDSDGWQSADGRENALTQDALLRAALHQGGWFWRRERDGKICLRCRWRSGALFPAAPLFCLMQPERGWLTLWLDGAGNPILPP